ncbi:MAG: ABC transporter ATP-binding protein [Myxococcales bacterium]|nr:ABC transporter ATP-binding protein [Myxococcales bacterium]
MTALRLEQLTVRYGDFVAVDALDLEVLQGELFGLLGPNGAGKSTTLRVLTGQLRPSSGRVFALGHDLERDLASVKPRLGYVPDRDNHFEELSARQNLELFADLYGVPRRRVDEVLSSVELGDAADLAVRGFSQGMRKKLLIARALLHEPTLIYLDEPTTNLDVHSARLVRRLLQELSASGKTVLLTTHDMAEVDEICTRMAVISRGRCIAQGTPAELKQAYTEHRVDAVLGDGQKRSFDFGNAAARAELAELIRAGRVVELRSQAQDLEAAFIDIVARGGA